MTNKILNTKPKIINVGLESFVDEFKINDVEALHLDWRPPARGNIELGQKLSKLLVNKDEIDKANEKAMEKIIKAQPTWVDVGLAKDVIPGFTENTICHAGPPIEWERMCGPMQGAVIGALIYEGKAKNEEEAREFAGSSECKFLPCHSLKAVGPMAGVFSANMPVIVVENKENGNISYSPFNSEGRGRPLSFGAFGEDTQEMLRFLRDVVGPALQKAIRNMEEGINLKSIISKALQMGDDCHNRLVAATGLLWKALAPEMAKVKIPYEDFEQIASLIQDNDWFFLNFSMAACKATMDSARDIKNSSLVTVMARNGTEVGIQVSGLGDQWFTTKAPKVKGMYFPGYTEEDANPDIGDSAITETSGIGAFAMAAALSMTQLVGGTIDDAIGFTKSMKRITLAESKDYLIPQLNFEGTPTGIDLIKVIEKGILPIINTGIASKLAGVGNIGAGMVSMPMDVFEKALKEF